MMRAEGSLMIEIKLVMVKYNRFNLVKTTRLNQRADGQREQKKSHAMSYDSKNYGFMKKCSINRTLLNKQYWMKSHDEVIYRKTMGRRDVWQIIF